MCRVTYLVLLVEFRGICVKESFVQLETLVFPYHGSLEVCKEEKGHVTVCVNVWPRLGHNVL